LTCLAWVTLPVASYRQHSSQDHVTSQAPPRQSRDVFGGNTTIYIHTYIYIHIYTYSLFFTYILCILILPYTYSLFFTYILCILILPYTYIYIYTVCSSHTYCASLYYHIHTYIGYIIFSSHFVIFFQILLKATQVS
jgi:hypothetical protein